MHFNQSFNKTGENKKHEYFLRSDLPAKTSAIDTPIQIHAYSTTNYYLIGNADQWSIEFNAF